MPDRPNPSPFGEALTDIKEAAHRGNHPSTKAWAAIRGRQEGMSAEVTGSASPSARPGPGLRLLLLDFGGVVAEEGFRAGLRYLARIQNLDS